MNNIIRSPYVAGRFYPGTDKAIKEQLQIIKDQLDFSFLKEINLNRIFGGVLPHAGHVYSAYQTLAFFELMRQVEMDFDSFVILHPLHRGGHLDYACDNYEYWETPLGKLTIDIEFIKAMEMGESSDMLDTEHSAEVILPYIQYYNFNDKMIIPIGIARQTPDVSKIISDKIIKAKNICQRKICVIASSDFSHFLSPEKGFQQDQLVLDCIQKKDCLCMYDTILKNNISVCGYGPIMGLMEYSKSMNYDYKSNILSRGHSGEVSPSKSVVDYISILFYD